MKDFSDPRRVGGLLRTRHLADILTLKAWALSHPWDGRSFTSERSRFLVGSLTDLQLRLSLILTFDHGAHASGWWRNSEYETCWHLSMCAITRTNPVEFAEVPTIERRAWAFALFGEDATKCWNEPPAGARDRYRTAPQSRHTWHTRLFVDQAGRPIVPTGEVYTLVPFDDGTSPDKIFR